ncbi:MAG: hypothetical protein NVS2B14_15660 [Chamaesiphon sp.]
MVSMRTSKFFQFLCLVVLALALVTAVPTLARGTQKTNVQVVVEKVIAPRTFQHVRTAIAGNYALATVSNAHTGGQLLLKKESRDWKVIQQTGGAYRASDLVKLGIELKIASQLQPRT